jgi:hypothetical protein
MLDIEDKPSLKRVCGRASMICTLAVFLVVPPASASCAWVLWGRVPAMASVPGTWLRESAHPTLDDCQAAAAAEPRRRKELHEHVNLPPLPFPVFYSCWPDTVDPSRPPGAP